MASCRVQIIERKTNRIASSMTVTVNKANAQSSVQDFEDAAWRAAIDGEAIPTNAVRLDYEFIVAEDLTL